MAIQLTSAGDPDEVSRGLLDLQRYLADHAHTATGGLGDEPTPTDQPAPDDEPGGERDVAPVAEAGAAADAEAGGESARVRRLRAEVAEARALVALQAQTAPLQVDSRRVLRRRRAVAEAARLHALGQDPAALAWRAARWRRTLTCLAMTALVLALGWSTAGVQHFAADGARLGSAGWWLAWLVEPLISLALLFVVGARAFFASRGQPLTNRVLARIEALFLAITVTMNIWPYLPWVATDFSFAALLIHTIGPIVAVSVVTAMPRVWHGFTHLQLGRTHPTTPPAGPPGDSLGYRSPTAPKYRPDTTTSDGPTTAAADRLLQRALDLIASGRLPARPSASQLRTALGCGTDTARRLRDVLATTNPDAAPPGSTHSDSTRNERQEP